MSSSAPPGGLATEHPAFAGAMLASLSYGIYLILTTMSLYFLLFRRNRSMALVTYTLLLFVSTSLFLVSEWIWSQREFSHGTLWMVLDLRGADWNDVIRAASLLATVALAEGLMMWRCLVVWDNALFILVLPVLLSIASLVLSVLVFCGIGVRAPAAISTLVCGGVLTLLIAGRIVWRRLGFLAAVVESSAVYTAAGIALVVLLFVAGENAKATSIGGPFLVLTMSIAPMLVVLRVALGRNDTPPDAEALSGARPPSSASLESLYPNPKRPYSTTLTMTSPGGMNTVLLAQLRRGTSASGSTYRDSL